MYDKLWSKDFISVTIVNFLMYLIHYTLIVTVTIFTIDKYHASESMGGLAAGIFIIGMLFGRLASGRVIDNLQPKKVLLFGIIFSIITVGLYFAIHSLLILMFVRLLHGIAFGLSSTATGTISSRIIPEKRKGEGIGYYALSVTTASAIGPFCGIILNQQFGFQSIFIVSLIVIVAALIVALLIKELPKVSVQTSNTEKVTGVAAYIQKEALPISFVIIFVGIAYSSVLSFLTVYTEQINLATASSFFFVVYAVSTFVTRPFTGKIYDNYGENKVMYPVLISFIIGLILLSLTHTSISLLIAAVFIGIGYGTIVPTAQAIAIQQSPTDKIGLATSTFYMFADFGAGIGPFVLGVVIPLMGYRNLYLTMAVLVIVSIVLYYFMHGKQRARQPY
ncbi:MFS transporter [Staphylococcus pseudoxylosus]|uniref:MFS transporter n=1 Tax=Staphylococcus pseudoxylosus TaxID=2282419 RepID=UPI000D1D235A|nr:MFS transporter [Staphylococcus pseudoxylosus]PTI43317.1 MFS transporter [Staphylococcus xylosus]MDW8797019.1 MFS transporter [Staphylococcus pseudoxylosus]MEB6037349.1 MFS transporter [Staphylococcus pseudoxylosus]MEB6045580.1 MFS transporter [Staphylococcus pseudoxylosus]MEB7764359.1 MFS transporter [Staphylococcus pseudoxylosus]